MFHITTAELIGMFIAAACFGGALAIATFTLL